MSTTLTTTTTDATENLTLSVTGSMDRDVSVDIAWFKAAAVVFMAMVPKAASGEIFPVSLLVDLTNVDSIGLAGVGLLRGLAHTIGPALSLVGSMTVRVTGGTQAAGLIRLIGLPRASGLTLEVV